MIVDRYYYSQLNNTEKAIYKAFYKGVMEHREIIPLPVKGFVSQTVFEKVFEAVTKDNPLIYFLNQSACSIAQDGLGHTAICPQYFYKPEKIKEYNRKIEKTVNGLAEKLKLTEDTDYEKELRVHDWICQNITYDCEGSNMANPARVIAAHNIIGALSQHRAQCEGIAKTAKVLLNVADMKCIVVTGYADGNGQSGPHAWNVVKLEDVPYLMDITWDIGAAGTDKDHTAYDYFNVADADLKKTHKAEGKLPECSETKENYFVKNRIVFDSRRKLFAYLQTEIESGRWEFYFCLKGRLKSSKMMGEITEFVSEAIMKTENKGSKCRHMFNEDMGVCWIQIYTE